MEAYFLLVTLHVILFAYWLGGDFGVYVCSRYIARPDLSLSERERFLEALLAIYPAAIRYCIAACGGSAARRDSRLGEF